MANESSEQLMAEVTELEKQIDALKVHYDQYFLGILRAEPWQQRSALRKTFMELTSRFIRNTAVKFRLNAIQNKWMSFNRQWDRILKEIEAGTYKPHIIKAQLRERERLGNVAAAAPPTPTPPAAPPGAPVKGDAVDRLTQQFLLARAKTGESTKGVDRARIEKVVQRQAQSIRDQYKCKTVEFKVVIEDGQAKIKATPKR